MKTLFRTALVAVLYISMLSNAIACDICGCSISNNNPFLFPNASRHFIGMSTHHRNYQIHSDDGTISLLYATNLLLSAQYAIGNRFRLQAVLPYIINQYGEDAKKGLGDISLSGNYTIWNKTTGITKHMITLTAGIKLNTASSTPSANPSLAIADLQTGSGSMDYLFAAGYRVTHVNWIALLQAGYRYNNQDKKSGLRFGDITTASFNLYHKIPFSSYTLTPYLSANIETRMDDARAHVLVHGSGGRTSLLGAGVDINTRKIAIGLSFLSPLTQSLANGSVKESVRMNTHLFFTL